MSELSLGTEFPKLDEADWRAMVDKALKGADFDRALVSKTYDDLTIKPLYTFEDAVGPDKIGHPGTAPYLRGVKQTANESAWDIRQVLSDPDPQRANALILEDLEGGVSSIHLRTTAPGLSGVDVRSADDLATTLDGVFLDYACVSLEAGSQTSNIAAYLETVWANKNIPAEKAKAEWNADPLGVLAATGGLEQNLDQSFDELAKLVTHAKDKFPKVRAISASGIPYHEAGATEAQEIACLASTLVAYLRALETRNIAPDTAFPKVSFALSADADFFLNIAKLRAARAVIYQIAKSSGAEDVANTMRINVRTSERMMAKRDPYVNMLRTTLAAAGAGLGGADSVTVLPYTWPLGLPDRFARRIARNTQLVLQEESSLGRIVDPAGGSWFIEQLTNDLRNKSWETFQKIESDGGIVPALQKGEIQAMIAEARTARSKNIATAKDNLTGVSAFPHLQEEKLEVSPRPAPAFLDNEAITVEALPLKRFAEPFESLRDASDRFFEKHSERPKVFLANLGVLKEFNARSTYAQNFFATGGIEAIKSEPINSDTEASTALRESGAKIVCLCSSDKIYKEQAEETAKALKEAGATHIYMAGRPGDMRDALKSAGVATFIHTGCDMLEVLSDCHDLLDLS